MGDGGTLRTFFAVEIGEDARRAAAALAARLRDEPWADAVRWTRPEALHVTLRFLGPTPPDRVAPLVAAVERETAPLAPFSLQLGGLGAFPNARRPRVLVVEVEPHEPLAALAAAVERGAVAAGFPPEERRFNGHLTLGRQRDERRRIRLPEGVRCEAAPFPVEAFVLFRSLLAPGGSQYTPLAQIALGGVASP